MARDGREVWSKRVERWKDSGLTAKEFAAEMGINAHTLAYWSWKLSGQSKPRRVPAVAPVAKPIFVEVGPPAAVVEPAQDRAVPADPLELVLPDGLRVRVPVHFDETVLRRVMIVLADR